MIFIISAIKRPYIPISKKDNILKNNLYFSIKVVDEYYLIDRNIPREQHEEILLPYLIEKGL